jgi:hypothetical protein
MPLKYDPNCSSHYRRSQSGQTDSGENDGECVDMRDLLPTGLASWSWRRWLFIGVALGGILAGVWFGFQYQDFSAALPGVGVALCSTIIASRVDRE